MTQAVLTDSPTPRTHSSAVAGGKQASGFLVGPYFDLFFVANLFWPLLFLVDVYGGVETHHGLLFWQVYFITTPHRWITLVLVACDRERTHGRAWKFLLLGCIVLAACFSLRFGTGSLLCLGAIDYVWNAWHFASQHHGIFRIYERRQGAAIPKRTLALEKVLFRGFLLYIIARVAGWGWSAPEIVGGLRFQQVDGLIAFVPAWVLVRYVVRAVQQQKEILPGLAYLGSVCTLFLAMLYAAATGQRQLMLQLALASAVFHAVEYLAIVTYSTRSDKNQSRQDLFGRMSQLWLLFLVVFVVVLGIGNYFLSRGLHEVWILMNFAVAFLHYSYDGMIWKSPRRA